MGRIRMRRIRFGSAKNKKSIKKNSTKGNQHRCPSCGRYM